MLSGAVKDHHTKQQGRKEGEETRRVEAVNATNKMTHALVDHLNSGVAQAYCNQVRPQRGRYPIYPPNLHDFTHVLYWAPNL
jgi:hypothetical protein